LKTEKSYKDENSKKIKEKKIFICQL
jgi:hypothetical protein